MHLMMTILQIPKHKLIRSDNPSNQKRDSVCICYKELPLKIDDKLCNFAA